MTVSGSACQTNWRHKTSWEHFILLTCEGQRFVARTLPISESTSVLRRARKSASCEHSKSKSPNAILVSALPATWRKKTVGTGTERVRNRRQSLLTYDRSVSKTCRCQELELVHISQVRSRFLNVLFRKDSLGTHNIGFESDFSVELKVRRHPDSNAEEKPALINLWGLCGKTPS
jgi:hypothetical protein